jgi:hypothetical protein
MERNEGSVEMTQMASDLATVRYPQVDSWPHRTYGNGCRAERIEPYSENICRTSLEYDSMMFFRFSTLTPSGKAIYSLLIPRLVARH